MKIGKNIGLRKIIVASSLFFATTVVFSQVAPKRPVASEYSWRVLEDAQIAYDSTNYGEAMNLANRAKENRKSEIAWELYVLENALSPLEVRRAGDEFKDVLEILKERDENEAINIINKYLNLYGSDIFDESISNLVEWVRKKGVYPEADFLIGRIYQLEGEYPTAYSFYEKARLERKYLDIPNTHYEILYAMVNLALEAKKADDYEQALLLILDSDEKFKDKVFQNAFMKILDADRAGDVDRFFMLFRADENNSLEALYELGNLRQTSGRDEEALICSTLASIEAFTHIYGTICERDTSYSFTTYSDFLEKCGKYDDILDWCEKQHVWEIFFQLAERLQKRGKLIVADSFFKKMAESVPDEYWRSESSSKILK